MLFFIYVSIADVQQKHTSVYDKYKVVLCNNDAASLIENVTVKNSDSSQKQEVQHLWLYPWSLFLQQGRLTLAKAGEHNEK